MTESARDTRVAPAWILREVTHVPGVLHLADSRLTFRSSRRVVFEIDLAAAVASGMLTVPRLHPVGVFDLAVDGERHRVHLRRPPGTTPPSADLLADLAVRSAGLGLDEWAALVADARRTSRGSRGAVTPPGGAHRRLTPSRWRPVRARRGSAATTPRS